ncbi:MAG: hypothetical protein J6Y02_19550 [Pseudobutyrivibrio sp.]|nr:hypothetical protein [Pseudobutyrivibrio sp.]
MNEIEKMYENANVKSVCDGLDCFTCNAKCNNGKYPPFTAEKQLKLIKWLFDSVFLLCLGPLQNSENFENSLVELVNNLWQGLAEEQKQQIKEILK